MNNQLLRKIIILAITIVAPLTAMAVLTSPQWSSQAAPSGSVALPGQKQGLLFSAPSKPLISASQTYTVTDLQTLGGTSSSADAISKNGQVAGYSKITKDTNSHAFRYNKGVMQDLGELGGGYSAAYGINNAGWVVGESENATTDRAFLYIGSPMIDLGTLGGDYSVAWGINNHGQVVGEAELTGNKETHAFVYTNTTMTDLGVLGTGSYSYAIAVNDKGQVVGGSEYDSSKNTHAFLYSNGAMHDLRSLGGNSSANAINDNGQVVGYSYLPNGNYVAFISDGTTIQQVGGSFGGNTNAYGINNKGQVVGSSYLAGNAVRHAMLIDNGQTYDLNNLIPANSGWVLTAAYGINDNGQIVGLGVHNGKSRAFLLTPPLAWTLMVYLSADGNLVSFVSGIFNQLELAANNPFVKIVVLWDPPGQNDTAYYEVKYDTNLNALANYTSNVDFFPQNELNMGDPNTLVNFVNWAETNYKAKYFALILVDHGTGLNGSMIDDQLPNDMLTVKEMGAALDTISKGGTKKMDVLQEYSCLMGMVEDGYQVRNDVSYYVASENEMWGVTTPFRTTVSGIVSTTTPLQLANLAAKSYADVETASNSPFTVSSVDLSQVNSLTPTINVLAQVLNSRMVTAAITLTAIVSPSVQRYDANGDSSIDVKDTNIDLYDFARLVKINYKDALIKAAAQAVMDAVSNSYVLYEKHGNGTGSGASVWNLSNSHGVAIFFPGKKSTFYTGNNLDFAAGTAWISAAQPAAASNAATADWGNMLATYMHTINPGGGDEPNPPGLVDLILPPGKIFLPLIAR